MCILPLKIYSVPSVAARLDDIALKRASARTREPLICCRKIHQSAQCAPPLRVYTFRNARVARGVVFYVFCRVYVVHTLHVMRRTTAVSIRVRSASACCLAIVAPATVQKGREHERTAERRPTSLCGIGVFSKWVVCL